MRWRRIYNTFSEIFFLRKKKEKTNETLTWWPTFYSTTTNTAVCATKWCSQKPVQSYVTFTVLATEVKCKCTHSFQHCKQRLIYCRRTKWKKWSGEGDLIISLRWCCCPRRCWKWERSALLTAPGSAIFKHVWRRSSGGWGIETMSQKKKSTGYTTPSNDAASLSGSHISGSSSAVNAT